MTPQEKHELGMLAASSVADTIADGKTKCPDTEGQAKAIATAYWHAVNFVLE